MPGHNVALERHRYVWVRPQFVLKDATGERGKLLPAVWFGLASEPGEALGCHVLLESGAIVHDLPLHALASRPDPHVTPALLDAVGWDCFSAQLEVVEYDYLDGRRCDLLDRQHRPMGIRGVGWFAVDWVGDGYSTDPAQRKHLHVIATDLGNLVAVPQDRLLWHDPSFTEVSGVPAIQRQDRRWSVEALLVPPPLGAERPAPDRDDQGRDDGEPQEGQRELGGE